METTRAYATIIAAWQLGSPETIAHPDSGTINTIVRATIAGRTFYLRQYRHPERAAGEHATIAHVRSRGFPAIAPLPLPDSATVLDCAGGRYALYPQAPGRQVPLARLTPALLSAMGNNLAALHDALRDLPRAGLQQRIVTIDRDRTLAGIARIEAALACRDGSDPRDRIARERLASRRAWLQQQPALTELDPAALNEQPIHGDYQETNLFFADDDTVCAVIDWDQGYLASRAWEIARVLDYVCGFVPAPSRRLLAAYRAHQNLTLADLDCAITAYGVMWAHDLWLYEEYFLAGNKRVGQFIQPGSFVPLTTCWSVLRSRIGF